MSMRLFYDGGGCCIYTKSLLIAGCAGHGEVCIRYAGLPLEFIQSYLDPHVPPSTMFVAHS